jgi:hypothetical protein
MSTELQGVYASDITDTSGALHILKERSGKDFSPDTLHYFVREGKLPAYVFYNSQLTRWTSEHKRRGQGMLFLKRDIYSIDTSRKKHGRGATKPISDDTE